MKKFSSLLVSLERDQERRAHALEQLGRVGIEPDVVSAVDGHDEQFNFKRHRHLSRGKWWDMDKFKPGAFGCYLSHAACWRRIRDGADACWLICEDDIVAEKGPFDRLMQAVFPPGFDVIFVNAGTARFLDLAFSSEERVVRDFEPLDRVLLRLVAAGKFTDQLTPGSYGYFVSRKGADKLLQLMEREKICLGVDYAMVFGSLAASDLERIHKSSLRSNYLKIYLDNCLHDAQRQSPRPRVPLKSYIWNGTPVFRHRADFGSSLDHKKFLGFDVFD